MRNLTQTETKCEEHTQLVANVIAALLTRIFVKVTDPVSRYLIE